MNNFREMTPQWLQNGCSKKFQTFKFRTTSIFYSAKVCIVLNNYLSKLNCFDKTQESLIAVTVDNFEYTSKSN